MEFILLKGEIFDGKAFIEGLARLGMNHLDKAVWVFRIGDPWNYRPDVISLCIYQLEVPALKIVPSLILSLENRGIKKSCFGSVRKHL